jgi:hypothetical protein
MTTRKAKATADPPFDSAQGRLFGDDTRKAKTKKQMRGVGDKRTVVRVSRCWELFASATLLKQAVDENTL